MAERPAKAGARAKGRPNPFYVALLLASTAFAITAWVGYVGPLLSKGPARDPAAASPALEDWFNRRGTAALVVELALMTASALLAMTTDRWFEGRPPRDGPKAP